MAEKKIELEFFGIDAFGRPTFKERSGKIFYCFVYTLFSRFETDKARDWVRSDGYVGEELIVKGHKFDGEPSHPVNINKFSLRA